MVFMKFQVASHVIYVFSHTFRLWCQSSSEFPFIFLLYLFLYGGRHTGIAKMCEQTSKGRFSFQRATQWFSTLKMKCWDFLTVFFLFSSCSFNWSRLMCVLQPYRKWYQPCLKAAMDVCLQSVILAQVNNSFLTKKISQSQSLPLSTFCMTCQYLTTYQFYSFHDGERQRDLDFDFSYLTWTLPSHI